MEGGNMTKKMVKLPDHIEKYYETYLLKMKQLNIEPFDYNTWLEIMGWLEESLKQLEGGI